MDCLVILEFFTRDGGNNAKEILSCAPTAKGINKLIKN